MSGPNAVKFISVKCPLSIFATAKKQTLLEHIESEHNVSMKFEFKFRINFKIASNGSKILKKKRFQDTLKGGVSRSAEDYTKKLYKIINICHTSGSSCLEVKVFSTSNYMDITESFPTKLNTLHF